jgi:hypothetical protein
MASISWFTAVEVPLLTLTASFGSFLQPFVELATTRQAFFQAIAKWFLPPTTFHEDLARLRKILMESRPGSYINTSVRSLPYPCFI